MKKNILLHGATNRGSSNYGDYLYGEMIFCFLKEKGFKVGFYQPSTFFCKYLKCKKREVSFKEADLLIYIPGGYFGEAPNPRFKDNLIHFARFLPVGIWASLQKKKMIVIGVGAGPIRCRMLKWGIKMICQHSLVVTVRDHESYDSLKKLYLRTPIIECGDMIITKKLNQKNTAQIDQLRDIHKTKKLLLVHYNHDKEAMNKFAESTKCFVEMHPDYYVIVSSDCILNYAQDYFKEFRRKYGMECSYFAYNDPAEMTALIKLVDVVLTCKLHVGVVACTFNKSVIVAACHYEKTKRFYSQIRQQDRCIDLNKVSKETLLAMMNQYHNKKIFIEYGIIEKANRSWEILDLHAEAIKS